jgi:hypothetical protein
MPAKARRRYIMRGSEIRLAAHTHTHTKSHV